MFGKESKHNAKAFAEKVKNGLDSGMKKMGREAHETKEMAELFFKLLASKLDLENRTDKPDKEEVREAIEQLKDVGRLSVFTTAVILPGGVFSLMGLELLARKFGIRQFTFVPSAFRKNAEWKHPKGARVNEKKFKPRKGSVSDINPLEE